MSETTEGTDWPSPKKCEEVYEMTILRWREWGEAVVGMMVEAKPGENLLILTDTAINRGLT
jgi:hypothetical protein